MNICEIGYSFQSTKKIAYLSDTTFLEFDAVIVDWLALAYQSNNHDISQYHQRREGLVEFLKFKKIPIIYFAPTQSHFTSTDSRVLYNYHCKEFAPVPNFEVKKESGKKVNVTSNTALTQFLKKYEQYFEYKSVFTGLYGTVCMETFHSKKNVSFYDEKCIFLPELNGDFFKTQIEESFLKDLVEVAASITSGPTTEELPEWTNRFYLPGEKSIRTELQETTEKIKELTKILEEKQSQLKNTIKRKLLFTSSGNTLEMEVENVFRELGLEILEADRNRDDLVVKFGDKISVIEIKGVNGSSAEKHAAQLEKWSANYFERTDVRPKSVLVVNSFRDIPLNERTSQTFPHQMLAYSVQREHCLISTQQLLGLFFRATIDPSQKEPLINSLFETVGVYPDFNDWASWIDLAGN